MPPDEFEATLANLNDGFYLNANTQRRLVAETVKLLAALDKANSVIMTLLGENAQLKAQLRLHASSERAHSAATFQRSRWPGE